MKSLSINRQIYMAVGCALLLLSVLAGLSYAATSRLAETFSGYKETARQTIVANELQEGAFDVHLAAQNYRISPSAERAAMVNEHIDEIAKRQMAAKQTLAGDDVALTLTRRISQLTDGYRIAFGQIVTSMTGSDKAVADLSSIEASVHTNLDIIETFAADHGNTWLGRGIRITKQNFTRGHFLNQRFLLTDDMQTFEEAMSFLEEARSQIQSIHPTIYDIEFQERAFDTIGQVSAYIDAAGKHRDLVAFRNHDLYPLLDTLGTKTRSDLDELLGNAVDRQATMGTNGTESASKTLSLVIIISIIALSIGGTLGALVARNISGGVRGMADTMAELAGGNLDVVVAGTEQQHELGMMARALAVFKTHAENLQRSLEKERELSGLQRQFVSMVSHEFRTPLAIIDGSAQRLERRPERITIDRVLRITKSIRTSVMRLTDLMESVLCAARMEEGRIKFEPAAFELGTMIAEVCRNYADINPNYNIDVDITGLPSSYHGDVKLLRQVVSNLVSNAVKYSPDSTRVSVSGRRMADGHIVISVSDEGVGIPVDELEKLFERFFRASTSTGIPGSGIGLHLVKHLVELHEGAMSVRSAVGQGTTFDVRLPPSPEGEGAFDADSSDDIVSSEAA